MIEFETQKLWMKFMLSLCLVYFVIEHNAEASYIGFMILGLWGEFGEFARAYRDVRLQQQEN